MTYEYEKYATTKEGLREMLDTYGVAIIPCVLDEEECEKMLNGIWAYFECLTQTWETPITKDPATWREFGKLFPLHSMLYQHFSVGHAQVCWDLRQNEKVIDIFKYFWGKDELKVSFDGMSFNPPPEVTKRGWGRDLWLHSDQSFLRNGFECMQSWVTALDVNDGDATLCVLEGSHQYHREFAETYEITDKKDWGVIKERITFYEERGCQQKKIKCPKGSMVFWDSRTIHCGANAIKGRVPNFRAIVYLCYTPKDAVPAKDNAKVEKKRREAFEEGRTTNHWPHKPKLFAKTPRTYGQTIPEITYPPKPVLTQVGLDLI